MDVKKHTVILSTVVITTLSGCIVNEDSNKQFSKSYYNGDMKDNSSAFGETGPTSSPRTTTSANSDVNNNTATESTGRSGSVGVSTNFNSDGSGSYESVTFDDHSPSTSTNDSNSSNNVSTDSDSQNSSASGETGPTSNPSTTVSAKSAANETTATESTGRSGSVGVSTNFNSDGSVDYEDVTFDN